MNKIIPDTVLISKEEIKKVMSMKDIVDVVDRTFADLGENKTINPTKLTLDLGEVSPFPPYEGFMNAMPAYIGWLDIAGLKWAGGFLGERKAAGLPFIVGMILLIDAHMGNFIAALDGAYITNMRTGAQTAVALDYILDKKKIKLGIYGAGMQGHTQTLAIKERFEIEQVKIYDVSRAAAEKYAADMKEIVSGEIIICDNPKDAADADVVITVTQSKERFVKSDWIKSGTVFMPMGSYQECENDVITSCDKIIVDHVGQALHRGALKDLNSKGIITEKNITTTIGELAAKKANYVLSPKEKILCIPIGTGAMDVAVAAVAYNKILKAGNFQTFRFGA